MSSKIDHFLFFYKPQRGFPVILSQTYITLHVTCHFYPKRLTYSTHCTTRLPYEPHWGLRNIFRKKNPNTLRCSPDSVCKGSVCNIWWVFVNVKDPKTKSKNRNNKNPSYFNYVSATSRWAICFQPCSCALFLRQRANTLYPNKESKDNKNPS